MKRTGVSPVLVVLFLASGAAGLVYQVLWVRILALTLSVTVYAITTVLCAFMAGLGLGAFAGGRAADRLARPLVAYGVAELGVALCALVTPAILFHLGPVYRVLYAGLGGSGTAFGVARFLLAASVLLLPCTLMGATLPLLSRAVIRDQQDAGAGAGTLYAVNTFGAVAGCLLSGFVLIPNLGLTWTNAVAMALSAFVGVLAILLGNRQAPLPAATAAASDGGRWPMAALVAAGALGVSGFTALGYEIIWTRALEQYTHNSVYAYSAMLATFLLGIALGSAVMARLADRIARPLLWLGGVEIAIGMAVIAALWVYAGLDRLAPVVAGAMGGLYTWGRVVALIFVEAGVVLLPMTLLFGATFPLGTRVVVDQLASAGRRIGDLYLANTLGSILGSVAVTFILLPRCGLRGTFLVLATVNLLLGLALVLRSGAGRARSLWAVLGVVGLGLLVLIPARLFEDSYERRFGTLLYYHEQVTDTVMVTEDAHGERFIRYGDGRGTAGTVTMPEDRIYAHIPMLLHAGAKRVLSICFGVGNSLAAVARHDIDRVDAVELSPGVIDAAPYFARTNRGILSDPKVHLTITDGRNYLLATDETYDVIRLDPPELHTAGIVNLYTHEFYSLARDHLRPGGIFSIWVNLVMTPEADLQLLVRTLADVFPYVSIWDGPYRYSWVINGSMTPHAPDLGRIMAQYADRVVREDLTAAGAADPYAFLQRWVMGDDQARAFAGTGPLVTDDHTILDFSVPKSLDAFFGFTNANTNSWLTQLMVPQAHGDVGAQVFFGKIAAMAKYKRSVVPYLQGTEASGLDAATIGARIEAASSRPPGNAPH